MVIFNEEKEERKFKQLREDEEESAMKLLAQKYGISYLDLTMTPINTDAVVLVPEAIAREAHLVVFNANNKEIAVGVHMPDYPETVAAIHELKDRGFSPTLHLVSSHSLEFAWARYKDVQAASGSTKGLIDVSNEGIQEFAKNVAGVADVKKFVEEALASKKAYHISRLVEIILAGGLGTRASDIHIEAEEASVKIRFRLDGILNDIVTIDRETYRLVLSRLKLLSGLKLNVQGEPQDGRFSIKINDTDIEIRTSTLPGAYGESVVMRILNPDAIQVTIEKLGMEKDLFDAVQKQIDRPNGMILVTGPTGSGKTTTLYAFLNRVHNSEVKIITIEDPIEYHLDGIVQTQTDEEKGYTFAGGLRAALRQDPDVIMVGEIRDKETAEIAIHAALTGHIVFSTLHTNNAAGSFPRLIDLNINPKIISSAINIALAQRLVRKLCDSCKKQAPLEKGLKEVIDEILTTITDQKKIADLPRDMLWQAVGCEKCGGSGYKGRIGVFEAILVDEAVDAAIRNNPSEREIAHAALPQGIFTMRQDGIVKALRGVTTIDEVTRVVDLTD